MKNDNDKRTRILDTAAEMFAAEPFHKVLLSDVASRAAVGKGTLYLYFKSKDDLYLGVLFRGFSLLVEKIQTFIAETDLPADETLGGIIDIMAGHLVGRAVNMGLLGGVMGYPSTDQWREKRKELWQLVEEVIRRGVAEGVFEDANPMLTGRYVTGLLRSACLFKPTDVDGETLCAHARAFVLKGLSIQ